MATLNVYIKPNPFFDDFATPQFITVYNTKLHESPSGDVMESAEPIMSFRVTSLISLKSSLYFLGIHNRKPISGIISIDNTWGNHCLEID